MDRDATPLILTQHVMAMAILRQEETSNKLHRAMDLFDHRPPAAAAAPLVGRTIPCLYTKPPCSS